MQHNMNDQGLLQEIEEDLQRQRVEALWKKYGNTVMGMAAAIVLGTALATAWYSFKSQRHEEATSGLMEVLDQTAEKKEGFEEALRLFAEKNKGQVQGTFALLQAGSSALREGQTDKALELYNQLATDEQAEPLYRQLGDLMVVQIQLDTADPVALEARLEPLMKPESAWRFSATEFAAHIALRQGDKEKAKKLFTSLQTMPDAPKTVVKRASDMLQWLAGGV